MRIQSNDADIDRSPPPQSDGPRLMVIVDDEPSFRARIESWIAMNDRYTCVATCDDGESGLEAICSERPDVALVDFGLPDCDGDTLICEAKMRVGPIKIVVASGIPDESVVFRALAAGADGFLDKDRLNASGFFAELEEALAGGCPLSERARRLVVRAWQKSQPHPAFIQVLTKREREVASLACRGLADAAIADQLGISPETVHSHEKRIYDQLAVHSRAELQMKLLRRPEHS